MFRAVAAVSFAMAVGCAILCTGCGGAAGTQQNVGGNANPAAPPPPAGDISVVNHVLIMMQENRSFDHYFWAMTDYRQRNGIPINSSDGHIKDGSDPDAAKMTGNNISPGAGRAIPPHLTHSQCTEDLTPDWAESHREMDLGNPGNIGPNSKMNGFANVAYFLGKAYGVLVDPDGRRAMGYFDDSILNYYYFMASNFAMGDMFFSPVPSRTSANRLYIHAATTQGHVHPDDTHPAQMSAKTIWRALDDAGVSWKIYITDWNVRRFTFFQFFTDYNSRASHAVSIDEYFADVKNGTLPAVAFIETGMQTGRDEHPTNVPGAGQPIPPSQAIRVQAGAAWSAQIINALMTSQSWKDSVFFFTFDEGGGAMDHVPPINVPSPDGIRPKDFIGAKDCFNRPCGSYDFTVTGFRVPNFIVSPFAKRNYVSHTPMDYTAILRFIETRWKLAPLNARDAAMPDMTEFFDFGGAPWATPPSPPEQKLGAACNFGLQ